MTTTYKATLIDFPKNETQFDRSLLFLFFTFGDWFAVAF